MKNILSFIFGIISFICLTSSSIILWHIMIQSACKMTVVSVMLFLVGCVFMHHFSKTSGIKILEI